MSWHRDIARASTPSSDFYLDPARLRKERVRIFHRSWQYAGHAAQLPNAGSHLAVDVQGEPLILLRDASDSLRALSNVCRHRAGPLVTGAGQCRLLQCRYHGWTYELDGRLRRAPEMAGAVDFDPQKVCLPQARVASLGPLLFVNLDAAAEGFASVLGEIHDEIAERQIDLARFRLLYRKDYVVRCNWKLYVDNYLEGYHIPLVHPALHRELDYAAYRVEPRRLHSRQFAPLRQSGNGERRYADTAGPLYYWLFPNFMLNVYPDNISTNLVLPLDHETTLTVFEWFVPADSALFADYAPRMDAAVQLRAPIPELLADRDVPAGVRDLVGFSDTVQAEDIAICEAVQRNLTSQFYARGRYAPGREIGVHHFHRLTADWLQEELS